MKKEYYNYLVGVNDQFDSSSYASVNDEIRMINEKTGIFPSLFKIDIIISFLKDHSLRMAWIEANPRLTELVTSESMFSGSIESLFESCRNNPLFRQDLVAYLKENLAA